MRRVRAAPAGTEPVDGEGDRGREVGRVTGAAAGPAPMTGRPTAAAAAASSGAVGVTRVHPRPLAHQLRLEARAAELVGEGARRTPSKASRLSARRSQTSRPMPGTTLKASPTCSTVGTAVRRWGPCGSWLRGHRLGRRGQREQRVDPLVGRRARVRRCARGRSRSGCRPPCGGRPRPRGRPSAAAGPASKHRHCVEALEARGRGRRGRRAIPRRRPAAGRPRANSPARVARARRRPSASTSPPFMSIAPEPRELLAVARQRAVLPRGRRRCRGAPAAASAAEPDPARRSEQVSGVIGRGALRSARSSASSGANAATSAAASSAPCTSPLRRRDRDERLELALGAGRDGGGVLVRSTAPRLSVPFHAMASAPHVGDARPRLRPGGHGRNLPSLRPPRAAGRAALLPRRRNRRLHAAVLLLPRPLRRHERARCGGRRDLSPGPRLPRGLHPAPRADRAAAGRRRSRGRARAYGVFGAAVSARAAPPS